MANKPFEIQSSTLTIGGVDLQAGDTSIVIPGVTQATSYKVEEVEDTGDQSITYNAPPIIIDAVTYADYVSNGTSTNRAEYEVEEINDDNYIDDIKILINGSYTSGEASINSSTDMRVYIGSAQDPFVSFVSSDWTTIPFRPKMRAGGIEIVGGGLGGTVVERSVEFPLGEAGDTRGTIALTPDGTTYICTEDWADASIGLRGTFTAITVELYNTGQSGGVYNSAVLSIADELEIYNILRYGNWTEGQFTIDAGSIWGGVQNIVSTGYNDQTGIMSLLWQCRLEDPQEIPLGTSVTVVYTGSGTQTPIWKKLVDLVQVGEGYGEINWRSEGDLTIETLRPQGYTGDCDLNLYAADDVFITANGDEVNIQAFTNVTIESNDGNHAWTFAQDGSLQLPGLMNTGYQNGYSLNGPTLRLGGENDPTEQIIITGPVPDSNNANAQRFVIQGQRGYGAWGQPNAGEGGDVYIWGGVGGEASDGVSNYGGSGGDIKIRGGQGQNNDGGYVKIEGGSAAEWNSGSHTGGFIEISGGDTLYGNGNGGDVNIRGGRGTGTGNNGEVWIKTGVSSEYQWQFDNGGTLTMAGAVVNSTATKTATPNIGIPLTLGDSTWPVAVADGSYGPFTGSIVGIVYTVVVTAGIAAYTIVSYPGTIAVNTTIDQLDASSLGGTLGNTSNIMVTSVNDSMALDLNKSINKLADGFYTLADGVEGQIMYLVPQSSITPSNVSVDVGNYRIGGFNGANGLLYPFRIFNDANASYYDSRAFCTLIFTDGAWEQNGGSWD